jgi:hypothetical protein
MTAILGDLLLFVFATVFTTGIVLIAASLLL